MSLLIEVRSETIEGKHGTSRKTGRPYSIFEQPAFVSLATGESRRITLQHEEGDKALPVAKYEPKPSAHSLGDFGALSISTRAKHWDAVKTAPVTKAA